MEVPRFLVLGLLVAEGPAHGHELRRRASESSIEAWSGVKVGSLYSAIRGLARDGLIEEVRREREGSFPERVVYSVTETGRREFVRLVELAVGDVEISPDPVDLGVAFALASPEAVGGIEATLARRLEQAERRLRTVSELRETMAAAQPAVDAAIAVIRHRELKLEAEVAWHRDLLSRFPARFRRPESR